MAVRVVLGRVAFLAKPLLLALLLSCSTETATAALVYWSGDINSDWGEVGNWSEPRVPGEADVIGFNHAAPVVSPDLGTAACAVAGLQVEATAGPMSIGCVAGGGLGLGSAGIAIASGAGKLTLTCPLTLLVNEVWDNDDDDPLTINAGIGGTGGLTKTGSGEVAIASACSYSGVTTLRGGTLRLSGATGGLASLDCRVLDGGTLILDNTTAKNTDRMANNAAITLSGGNLRFLDNSATATSETLGPITLGRGNSTLSLGGTGVGTGHVLTTSLGARASGATLNFTGIDSLHKVVLGTVGFANQGTFIDGSDYAWVDTTTKQVRAINYASDTATKSIPAGTTIGANNKKHITITGAITAQTTIPIYTLKIGGPYDFSLASSNTVSITAGGILKTGSSAAAIRGGVGITTETATEMVIRTDKPADTLTLATPILASSTGGLTKTGEGKLLVCAAQLYKGPTTINQGVLQLAWPEAPVDGSAVWLDASDPTMVTSDASARVSAWKNKASTGYAVTQNVNAAKPLLVTNAINGRSVIHFDGSDDLMGVTSGFYSNTQTGMTMFIVARRQTAVANAGPINFGGPTSGLNPADPSVLTTNEGPASDRLGAVRGTQVLATVAHPGNNQVYLMDTVFNGETNIVCLNGVPSEPLPCTNAFNIDRFQLGAMYGTNYAAGTRWNGDLAEILIYNSALTDQQRHQVEAYLAHRWTSAIGPTDLLPPGTALSIGAGATLDLAGATQTVGSLSDGAGGGGSILLGSGRLTVGDDGTSTTFSGSINGSGNLVKKGSGVLRLSGSATQSGGTEVRDGVLEIASPNSLPGDAPLVIEGGKVTLDCSLHTAVKVSGLRLNLPTPSTRSAGIPLRQNDAQPVPEPSTVFLAVAAMFAVAIQNWRRGRDNSR